MTKESKMELINITKNSMISIGLVIILLGVVYVGAKQQGVMETRLEAHENLQKHKGEELLFKPKAEVDLQFKNVQRQLNELKAGQKEILEELKR